jgi:hypothetical protein
MGPRAWIPSGRERQCFTLGKINATKFAFHRNNSNWETSTLSRKIASVSAPFKAHTEAAWRAIGDMLLRPYYYSRVEHDRKIRSRKRTADMGKHSFVNKTQQL